MSKLQNIIIYFAIPLGISYMILRFLLLYIFSGQLEVDVNSGFFKEGGGFEKKLEIFIYMAGAIVLIYVVRNPKSLKLDRQILHEPVRFGDGFRFFLKPSVKGGDGKRREYMFGRRVFYYIIKKKQFREEFSGLYGFNSKESRDDYLVKLILKLYGGEVSWSDSEYIDESLPEVTKIFLGKFIKYYRNNQFTIEKIFHY